VIVIVVVKRDAGVVALNEAAGRRVVMVGRQGEAGIFAQIVYGLNEAFAEGGFTDDEGAVVILQCAGDDFGCRCGVAIDENYDGKLLAVVAVGGGVVLVGVGTAALGNDGLALGEKVVADFDGLAKETARIAAQVEDKALEVGEAVDGLIDFLCGGFLELGEVDVSDAGADLVLRSTEG